MKPYYDHAGITIYHGDCRDILPRLVYDVIVCDPPYGLAVELSRRGCATIAGDEDTMVRLGYVSDAQKDSFRFSGCVTSYL